MSTRPKTHRLEARIDADLDALIGAAAEATQVSKSAFVSDAVRDAALRALARVDITHLDAAVFDRLVDSLAQPDDSPELAALVQRARQIDW